MKKLLVILLVILALFAGFTAWNTKNTPAADPGQGPVIEDDHAPDSLPVEEGVDAAAAPAEPVEIRHVDYDAIRALHPEDETAIQMADESVTWGEFCGMLSATGRDIESYFDQMATYYGVAADWDGSIGDGSGQSYAQYAVSETREYLESLLAIRGYAREQGVALDEEQVKSLEPEELARLVLGEDASVGEFYAALDEEAHMSFETYRAMREANLLYTKLIDTLYGPAGEKVSEEDAVAWLEEQDYLAAGHILLMTIDPNTGDALDEAVVRAKRERAGEIAAELQAIEDQEALLKRFMELKEAECEDTGKTVYPEGYTFQPGTMVQEFEAAVRALGEYKVSDPVETAYGYHVIMRLPLKGDASLMTLSGSTTTARQELAVSGITADLDAFQEAHPAEYVEGLEEFELAPYIY